ncbi:glycosyltransferase [Chitinophaga sp. Mgbs1]|uniref:Glycosyltransferase n=1 Tax=Chitinophaga solisilvae TaxID=1233460 RepID=A0A9Q5D8Z4_9BACT|nr:glycosyltransferase [Chitinophaga solisilvae]
MKQPELSIIVPVYNVESYLEACLDGILQTDLTNREVIIVDDGSTDTSAQIINRYKQRYPGITVYRKENGGLSDARNYGLERATGKYVIFPDSDDLVHAGAFDKMIAEAERQHADIVVADYYEFSEEGKHYRKDRYDKAIIEKPLITEEERLHPLFLIDVSFAVWNKLYRRSFLSENNLTFLKGFWFEDLDFVFTAFYRAGKVVKVNEMLIGYRQRSGSIMKNINNKILDKVTIMEKLGVFLDKEGKIEKYRRLYDILFIKMCFSVLYACIMNRNDKGKSKELIGKVLENPYLKKILRNYLSRYKELKTKEKYYF